MTEDHDYLWDQRGPADAFVVELERRLAPLDDAEALLDELELDPGPLAPPSLAPGVDLVEDHDDAVVLVLHGAGASEPESKLADPRSSRSWAWLAAAIAVLGISVGVLATESRSRQHARAQVEIGAGTRDGHVVITADDPSIHARLRPAHAGLSACALALEPETSVSLRVDLELDVDTGAVEIAELDALEPGLRSCLVATLATIELDEPTTIELELHGPIAHP